MSQSSTKLVKAALSALHYSGMGRLLSPFTGGVGAIFALHQVCPHTPAAYSPNRTLNITPDFLDRTIRQVQEAGSEILSLDQVAARLNAPTQDVRPFVAFALNEAFRDVQTHALPVFRRHGVPFAVYASADDIDGAGDLWWLALEKAIAGLPHVACVIDGAPLLLAAASTAEKDQAYRTIYWRLRRIDPTRARAIVAGLCRDAGVDPNTPGRDQLLGWDELRELAQNPLVTIGGRTLRQDGFLHRDADAARYESAAAHKRLESQLGRPVRHCSGPFGDVAHAGVLTAVTSAKGLIHTRHITALTALPRVELRGDYQSPHYTKVLLSGVPFALYDMAKAMMPRSLGPRVSKS